LKHFAFIAKLSKVFWVILTFILLWFSLLTTSNASNKSINIQGRLVNSDGTNISAPCVATNTCDFRLTVYESADSVCNSSDTQVSQEVLSNVTLVNGIFNLALGTGAGSSIPTYDFDSEYTCVRIELDDDGNEDFVGAEDFGTIDFRAVPYSFNSARLDGKVAGEFFQVGGNDSTSGLVLGTNNNHSLSFKTDNVTRALFDTNGHFLPFENDTYDLGSNTNRWRDLYLGPDSLRIGTSTTQEAVLSYDTTNNVFNISTDTTTNGDIAFNTNQLFIDKSTGNVGLGLLNPSAKLSIQGSFAAGNNVTNTGANSFAFGSTNIYYSGDKDLSFVGEGYGGFDNFVYTSSTQSNGKIIVGGSFTSYKGMSMNGIARFNSDGSLDTTFNIGSGASSNVYTTSIQSDGKVIIGGLFSSFNGTTTRRIARLNSDGSLDTTFNVGSGAGSTVYTTSIQSDGKVIIGGDFTSYNGTAINRIARLNSDGSLDTTFNVGTGATNRVLITSLQSDGKVIIGGYFTSYNGTAINRIARLNSDGSLDTTFVVGTGVNNEVQTITIQSDGKVIIGGVFSSFNGTTRGRIARLNSDGSLDTTFNVGSGAVGAVYTTSIQSDGKVIIGGLFTSYNGTAINRIARLNTDGSLDTTFNVGTGANNTIRTTSIQSDGKVVIGGEFTSYNGTGRNYIARLGTDGNLDVSFNLNTGANNSVRTVSIQDDGRIIIGGDFTSYDNTTTNRIARINSDGSLDTTFNVGTGANNSIRTTSIQSDGKVIIGGAFTSYNGTGRNYIARLNSDGSLDTTFVIGTGATGGSVLTILIQTDGKIILGGIFTGYNGTAVNRIARLNTDGSLDTTFNVGTGANNWVYTTAIQSDGKVIIGGNFTSYNGTSINRIARLNSDGSLDTTFVVGTGASGAVNTTTIQSDGKIIIGGSFFSYNGTSINRIARLNSDGSLDTTFVVGTGASGAVNTTTIQSDGKVIIGGIFSSYNGTSINRIARLNSDGSLDTNFSVGIGVNNTVFITAIQSDGLIVGGEFTTYKNVLSSYMLRIYQENYDPIDLALDNTFMVQYGLSQMKFKEEDMILQNTKLGIGVDNPSYQLQLSQNSAAKPTSNSWTVVSDERLKSDVAKFDDGLNVIRQINPVSYMLNGQGGMPMGERGIGIIAQDMRDIAPYTISTFKAKLNPTDAVETELYSFDSSALTFVLINAVKEQQDEIDDIRYEINKIKDSLSLLQQTNQEDTEIIEDLFMADEDIATYLEGGHKFDRIVVAEDSWFKGRIRVDGHVIFGKDTAGQAIILSGDNQVRVEFESEYEYPPIVSLTQVGGADISNLFVDNVTTTGFDVYINPSQDNDVRINWFAFAVHKGNVFLSDGDKFEIQNEAEYWEQKAQEELEALEQESIQKEVVVEETVGEEMVLELSPTPTPEVTPEPTPEITPEPTSEITPEITPEPSPEVVEVPLAE
jgi:uncharacterized delta-60 repeat protein